MFDHLNERDAMRVLMNIIGMKTADASQVIINAEEAQGKSIPVYIGEETLDHIMYTGYDYTITFN